MKLKNWTDHLGRKVTLPETPQRIISLCPSITETLYTLGLSERVVGRTHFCIHPAKFVEGAGRIGGTKKVDYAAVAALEPDLIIAEKEENTREIVETLAADWPVYVTDVRDVACALRMIADLGHLTGTADHARALTHDITVTWATLKFPPRPIRVAYFIWRKPYMVVGADTYIHAVLQYCGLLNVCAHLDGRYPTLAEHELAALKPEVILLSSEPYPFKAQHVLEIQSLAPEARVILVDGEMFSWYGARMIQAADYLRQFIAGRLLYLPAESKLPHDGHRTTGALDGALHQR